MIIGKVSEVWRYPVKSMFGEKVEQAMIERMGIPEDRTWALRDEESGEIVGGKRIPGIMSLKARYTAAPQGDFTAAGSTGVEIEFPDGRIMHSSDPYISAALSMYLGRRISLCQRAPASDKTHYALAHAPTIQETRYALGIRPGEENPDLSTFSLGLLTTLSKYATPPGTYYDVYPLHFMTTASLDTMRRHYPEGDFRVERYRPSFLIETSPEFEGLVENTLRGARLKIGDCIIHCDHPTIRCSMPGAAQPGMAADPAIPMAVMRHADRHLGSYATPKLNGTIRVGDTVEVIPRRLKGLFNGLDLAGQKLRKSLLDSLAKSQEKQAEKENAADSSGNRNAPDSPALPPGFRPFELMRTEHEAPGIRSFYFRPKDGRSVGRYIPGQHVVLGLPQPDSKQRIYRPYTLSDAPAQDGILRITVKYEKAAEGAGHSDGVASSILHNIVKPGDDVYIRGPMGAFGDVPTDKHPLVMISGGIGITPFIAMLRAVATENPARRVQLFHSVRSTSELAFGEQLAQLRDSLPNFQLSVHVTGAVDDSDVNGLAMERGRMEAQSIVTETDASAAHYYVCGKSAFSQAFATAIEQSGVAQDRIHRESFGQPLPVPGDATTEKREVHFATSGQVAIWNGSHSLLELAENAGLNVASGCRYGACHACQATLVNGDYHYPEGVEEPTGKNQVLLCCMRPESDITLDL